MQVNWFPMNSAPHDGQPIILSLDKGKYGDIKRAPAIAYWEDDERNERYGWFHWHHRDKICEEPTAWTRIPSPPLDTRA